VWDEEFDFEVEIDFGEGTTKKERDDWNEDNVQHLYTLYKSNPCNDDRFIKAIEQAKVKGAAEVKLNPNQRKHEFKFQLRTNGTIGDRFDDLHVQWREVDSEIYNRIKNDPYAARLQARSRDLLKMSIPFQEPKNYEENVKLRMLRRREEECEKKIKNYIGHEIFDQRNQIQEEINTIHAPMNIARSKKKLETTFSGSILVSFVKITAVLLRYVVVLFKVKKSFVAISSVSQKF
jgi:hypothetical protein